MIVARACGYDFYAVSAYAGYFAAFVALPGVVVLAALNRGPLSIATVVALALPTGFAIEIFSYLGMASLGAKELYRFLPALWLAAGAFLWSRRKVWPVQRRVSGAQAGLALGMAVAFLATMVMAASQMFAESPLATGMPSRAIFHDWVYLVSRAAVIKNNWPLDDPSLSGTPLQYHYFMMVHAAAASATTGVELTLLLLRLMIVPLSAVMLAQAYLLGRRVARSPWGGVVAAMLVVMAGEASFAGDYGHPMYLGLFARWLFVSPTFFFGMIFCGALLLAIARCDRLSRCGVQHHAWLFLLAAAGTGAKGTVLPVVIVALGLLVVWRWAREGRFPGRLVAFGFGLSAGFSLVYFATMSAWRTGDAAFRPFHVFQLTEFWQTFLPMWRQALGVWLPASLAAPLAAVACALVVFAGTAGVRMLAIPYLVSCKYPGRDPLVAWLGAFFVASTSMGLLMELNSYGELYLVLMDRLPMAVLAAAFVVEAVRRFHLWRRGMAPWTFWIPGVPLGAWVHRVLAGLAVGVVAVAVVLQANLWLSRNRVGFASWLSTPVKLRADEQMGQLQEALVWIRGNTEPNAVIVANACTPENMKKDHWGALDRTLTGVHFYYSALSERRLWFEGPNYIMDTTRARIRANLASAFFYRGRPLDAAVISDDPCYALVDHSLADGAKVGAPGTTRVFANARIDIYRLPRASTARAPVGVVVASTHED
ncbi:MAG: hypothetical protein NTV51_14650 [Verrucomicrobia bacterium]|nr:hypothetical protein [Verrucomicrobiota bacterium]